MSRVDELPPLREVIARFDLGARKALGQNFLLDLNLTGRIARSAGDLSGVHGDRDRSRTRRSDPRAAHSDAAAVVVASNGTAGASWRWPIWSRRRTAGCG